MRAKPPLKHVFMIHEWFINTIYQPYVESNDISDAEISSASLPEVMPFYP
jgi:hypothetical protein